MSPANSTQVTVAGWNTLPCDRNFAVELLLSAHVDQKGVPADLGMRSSRSSAVGSRARTALAMCSSTESGTAQLWLLPNASCIGPTCDACKICECLSIAFNHAFEIGSTSRMIASQLRESWNWCHPEFSWGSGSLLAGSSFSFKFSRSFCE